MSAINKMLREELTKMGATFTEDELYDFEKRVIASTKIDLGMFPRAKEAARRKHNLSADEYDFLLWCATKDKVYLALGRAEFGDMDNNKMFHDSVKRGYLTLMNKAVHSGVRIPKFYKVEDKCKAILFDTLEMLSPEFRELHARQFYLMPMTWVNENIRKAESIYADLFIFGKLNHYKL